MRREDQYEFSAKVIFYSLVALVTLLVIARLVG